MRAAIGRFPGEVGEVTRLRFGSDLPGSRTDGYRYLLFSEFPDETALQRYREHPVHQAFLHWLRERDASPLGFDYHLGASTVVIPE